MANLRQTTLGGGFQQPPMPVCEEAGIRWYQVTERNKYSKHILTPNPEGTAGR